MIQCRRGFEVDPNNCNFRIQCRETEISCASLIMRWVHLSPKPLRDLFMQVRVGWNKDIVLLLILGWVDWVGLGWM